MLGRKCQAFKESAGQEDEATIDAASFTTFCRKTPEVTSWISYCGEVPEAEVSVPTFTDSDAIHVLMREKQVMKGSHPTNFETLSTLDPSR